MSTQVIDVAPGYRTRLEGASRFSAAVLAIELTLIGLWNVVEILHTRRELR